MTTTECDVCQRPTGDQATLCADCLQDLIDDLRAVPQLTADLTITECRQDRTAPPTVGGRSSEGQLPIRGDAGDSITAARKNLRETVNAVARIIADSTKTDLNGPGGIDTRDLHAEAATLRTGHRHDPALITDEPVFDFEVAALWLTQRPAELAQHPAAGEMHAEVDLATDQARAAVDVKPARSYKGPCQQIRDSGTACRAGIYAERDEDHATCSRCATRYDVETLDADNLDRVREMAFTIPELVTLLAEFGHPIPRSTLYSWSGTDQIAATGYRDSSRTTAGPKHRSAPAVYRLGDVIDHATINKPHVTSANAAQETRRDEMAPTS